MRPSAILRPTTMLLALALASCAGVPVEKQDVQAKDDQFSTSVTFISPKLFDNPFGGTSKSWYIRSFVDKKTGVATNQLYVNVSYIGDWKFFNTAADDTAMPLTFTEIDRSVGSCDLGSCTLYETFGAQVDEKKLRHDIASKTAYRVKFSAHSGDSIIITLDPVQMNKQIEAIDSYRRANGLPAT